MKINNLGLMDERRNHLMFSALMTIIGVFLVAGSRESLDQLHKHQSYKLPIDEVLVGDEHKKCPSCAEKVRFEAIKCRFCGYLFNPEDVTKEIAFREERLAEIRQQAIAAPILAEKRKKEDQEEFEQKKKESFWCEGCGYMICKNEIQADLFCPECGGLLQEGLS